MLSVCNGKRTGLLFVNFVYLIFLFIFLILIFIVNLFFIYFISFNLFLSKIMVFGKETVFCFFKWCILPTNMEGSYFV